MLLPLWCSSKKLQWLQWDFVISWTPHSLILFLLCSKNHCCWVEHRLLVALSTLAFDSNASCLFLASWCHHMIALLMPDACLWILTAVGYFGVQYLKTELSDLDLPIEQISWFVVRPLGAETVQRCWWVLETGPLGRGSLPRCHQFKLMIAQNSHEADGY